MAINDLGGGFIEWASFAAVCEINDDTNCKPDEESFTSVLQKIVNKSATAKYSQRRNHKHCRTFEWAVKVWSFKAQNKHAN
jgi:hypothetical protein